MQGQCRFNQTAFGLGDDRGSPYVRAKLDLGPVVMTASAFTFEEDGEGVITGDFGKINTSAKNGAENRSVRGMKERPV